MILKILSALFILVMFVAMILWLYALSVSDGKCEGYCDRCPYEGACEQQKGRENMKNQIYNGIMGLIVGDALGVPFEFK